jgi:thioredoxin 1
MTTIINTGKVLVDFWAPWCGPCQMLGPIIEEVEKEMGDKIKVQKINVDEETELAAQYTISSIPAVYIFVDGEVKETIVGLRQKQDYIDALNRY